MRSGMSHAWLHYRLTSVSWHSILNLELRFVQTCIAWMTWKGKSLKITFTKLHCWIFNFAAAVFLQLLVSNNPGLYRSHTIFLYSSGNFPFNKAINTSQGTFCYPRNIKLKLKLSGLAFIMQQGNIISLLKWILAVSLRTITPQRKSISKEAWSYLGRCLIEYCKWSTHSINIASWPLLLSSIQLRIKYFNSTKAEYILC